MKNLLMMTAVVTALMILTTGLTYGTVARADDVEEIKTCLAHWGKSPFKVDSPFRVVTTRVKVMGIGGDVDESTKTDKPELVLIRPAVAVMSKSILNLRNPNGWYCIKGEVAVMGKMEINLDCHAHFTSSKSGATVMGSDDNQVGTTVMGSSNLNRVGDCK